MDRARGGHFQTNNIDIMTDSFFDLAGVRFHYRVDGDERAPAVVLSNSLGTDLTMWEPQMPDLVRRYRVIRYDARGHGRSAVTPGPYTIAQMGRDVLGLLSCIGVERAHFCGLSLGGMTGMWLAANAGYHINRLVLANTTAYMPPAEMWNTRIETVRTGGMSAITPAIVQRWFTPQFVASHPIEVGTTRAMLESTPPEGYVAACAAVRDMDQRASLRTITRPTLVIAGAHDAATPPENARALVSAIPGATYVELPASHLSNVEAPVEFTTALLDFLF
jgi:3-oxoadipate enol-lactonase